MITYPVRLRYPMGGAGQHIRWLLFLDDKFSNFNCTDIDSKLTFLQSIFYHYGLDNWEYDHIARNKNWKIKVEGHDDAPLKITADTEIYLRFTKRLHTCLQRYLAIINTKVFPEHILDYYKELNYKLLPELAEKNLPNKLILDSDNIFKPILDKQIYYKLIEFLDCKDNYQIANQLHIIWYKKNLKLMNNIILI